MRFYPGLNPSLRSRSSSTSSATGSRSAGSSSANIEYVREFDDPTPRATSRRNSTRGSGSNMSSVDFTGGIANQLRRGLDHLNLDNADPDGDAQMTNINSWRQGVDDSYLVQQLVDALKNSRSFMNFKRDGISNRDAEANATSSDMEGVDIPAERDAAARKLLSQIISRKPLRAGYEVGMGGNMRKKKGTLNLKKGLSQYPISVVNDPDKLGVFKHAYERQLNIVENRSGSYQPIYGL